MKLHIPLESENTYKVFEVRIGASVASLQSKGRRTAYITITKKELHEAYRLRSKEYVYDYINNLLVHTLSNPDIKNIHITESIQHIL